MPNLQQAPKLLASGQKIRSKNYWSYDPELVSWIMVETGKSYQQLKLMLYLMGNSAGNWVCSTADICQRTGISDKSGLSKVKKALKDRGWIDYKEGDYIVVLYDDLYKQMKGCSESNPILEDKNLKGCSQSNPQGCCESHPQGCSESNHNNISNKIEKNNMEFEKQASQILRGFQKQEEFNF